MIYNPPIGSIYHLYTTYILPIGWSYITYHLLREPETAVDKRDPPRPQGLRLPYPHLCSGVQGLECFVHDPIGDGKIWSESTTSMYSTTRGNDIEFVDIWYIYISWKNARTWYLINPFVMFDIWYSSVLWQHVVEKDWLKIVQRLQVHWLLVYVDLTGYLDRSLGRDYVQECAGYACKLLATLQHALMLIYSPAFARCNNLYTWASKRLLAPNKCYLVGGWTNPFEKYAHQNWVNLPQFSVWK